MTEKKQSLGNKQLDEAAVKIDSFEDNLKKLTMDEMNKSPKLEEEAQTKLSQKEINNSKEIHLKPIRTIMPADKFNEKFRKDWEFDKETVQFIAEHKECIGQTLEIWTRPYGGVPAQEWAVPANKPVWGPRYLAEQIKRKGYHILEMAAENFNEDNITDRGSNMSFTGKVVVKSFKQRLDAVPVSNRRSVFMGRE